MTRTAARARLGALLVISLCLPFAAAAGPDWDAVADVGTVEVVTHDEDGSERDTTVWLAVVDGQGFIRTGGSRWGENLKRDPQLVLRIDGAEHPLRVEFIENDALRERVVAAFREKYGWTDGMLGWVRGDRPSIMHLLPR